LTTYFGQEGLYLTPKPKVIETTKFLHVGRLSPIFLIMDRELKTSLAKIDVFTKMMSFFNDIKGGSNFTH